MNGTPRLYHLLSCCLLGMLLLPLTAGAQTAPAPGANIECDERDPKVILTDTNPSGGRDHTITYCGREYDIVSNQTTFKYKVDENALGGLSNWVLQLCFTKQETKRGQLVTVVDQSKIASYSPVNSGGIGEVNIGTDPISGITGIKWNTVNDDAAFTSGVFTLTLNGYYGETPVDVNVAVKGGPGAGESNTLPGPSCTLVCEDPTDTSTGPRFDGTLIRDASNNFFIDVTAQVGASFFEFWNTQNLTIGEPKDPATGSLLPYSTTPGFRGGTLYVLDDPATAVRFQLTPIDPANRKVTFYLAVTDECGRAIDIDPQYDLNATAVDEAPLGGPLALRAAPNPFSDRTTIRFAMEEAGPARVSVYDALGRQVAVLADGEHGPGTHEVVWDGKGTLGAAAPTGVYLVRVQSDGGTQTVRMTLVR